MHTTMENNKLIKWYLTIAKCPLGTRLISVYELITCTINYVGIDISVRSMYIRIYTNNQYVYSIVYTLY